MDLEPTDDQLAMAAGLARLCADLVTPEAAGPRSPCRAPWTGTCGAPSATSAPSPSPSPGQGRPRPRAGRGHAGVRGAGQGRRPGTVGGHVPGRRAAAGGGRPGRAGHGRRGGGRPGARAPPVPGRAPGRPRRPPGGRTGRRQAGRAPRGRSPGGPVPRSADPGRGRGRPACGRPGRRWRRRRPPPACSPGCWRPPSRWAWPARRWPWPPTTQPPAPSSAGVIGSFQALKHLLADATVAVEVARAASRPPASPSTRAARAAGRPPPPASWRRTPPTGPPAPASRSTAAWASRGTSTPTCTLKRAMVLDAGVGDPDGAIDAWPPCSEARGAGPSQAAEGTVATIHRPCRATATSGGAAPGPAPRVGVRVPVDAGAAGSATGLTYVLRKYERLPCAELSGVLDEDVETGEPENYLIVGIDNAAGLPGSDPVHIGRDPRCTPTRS